VALLETLSDVLRRTDERVRRGLAGRELARAQFTWPAVAADLAHLYSTVAA
jgi:glycosyltransferase involved in cell wall biosynthesis